jgi:membrane-bound lytic murein transglycosylase MltF
MPVSYGTSADVAQTLWLGALQRAQDDEAQLQAAGSANGINWTLLAAIGIRETGFQNKNQSGGHGVGIFQIDLAQNPSVTPAQASDPAFAANWAAKYLATNEVALIKGFPILTGDNLTQVLADTYNRGLGAVRKSLRAGQDPDVGSARGNYGFNVLNLTKCF